MEIPRFVFVIVFKYSFEVAKNITQVSQDFLIICDTCYACRAIVLPIIRILIEPQIIRKLTKIEHDVITNPNIAFLSSSLNNLMVCSILKGVNLTLHKDYSDQPQLVEVKFDKV